MDERQYWCQQMLQEYDSLREEILQVYNQQMTLVFSATITVAAAFLVTLLQSSAILLSLPALFTILIGVCNKSIANYCRIYRIGSYIAVVHEQLGQPIETFRPNAQRIGWHSRWRRAKQSGLLVRTGGSGAKAEAWFLLLLVAGSWILVGGTVGTQFFTSSIGIVSFSISVILTFVLFLFLRQLARVFTVSRQYEKAFRYTLEEELGES